MTTAAAEAGHRNTTKHARKSLVKPVHPVVSSGTTTKFNKAPVNGLKQSQLGVCIGAAAAVQAYLQLLTGKCAVPQSAAAASCIEHSGSMWLYKH